MKIIAVGIVCVIVIAAILVWFDYELGRVSREMEIWERDQ